MSDKPTTGEWTRNTVQDLRFRDGDEDQNVADAHNAALTAACKVAQEAQKAFWECSKQLAAERKDRDDLAFRLNTAQDVLEEFIRVMEDPRTTAAMPHTVKKAKAALAKVKEK